MKTLFQLVLFFLALNSYAQADTLYFESGKIKTINDSINNHTTEFYENGNEKERRILKWRVDGLLDIWRKKWYSSGELKFDITLIDSINGFSENYYFKNGKLEKQEISKFEIIDSDTLPIYCYGNYFCENGQKTSANLCLCCNHVQDYVLLYCNGNIKLKTQWCRGSLVGYCKKYYENGKLHSEGQLEDCNPSKDIGNSHSIKIGEWKYYDELGMLIKKENGNNQELE